MPILSNQPLTLNGVNYDRLAVSMAVSPVWKADDLGPSLAIRFERYTKDENGAILRPETPPPVEGEAPVDYTASLVYSAYGTNDPQVEQKVRELMSIIQDLVNIKGI